MSVLIFHPSTAPFIQQAARALEEAGLLDRFYTTLCDDPSNLWQRAACAAARLGGYDLRRQLRRRAVTEVPLAKVTAYPFREIVRLLSGGLDRSGRLTDRVWAWAEPGFDRAVARRLHDGLRGVYGFEYSSLATFQAARARGLKVIYDVPAPEPLFVQAMINREVARFPVLDTPYHRHSEAREDRRIARRRAEWHAADLVIAASAFTKSTYVEAGLDGSRVRVVPYGAPPVAARDAALAGPAPDAPVQFLWAGTFSIRKGAHYLLEAWRQGGFGRHARLIIHGAIALPDALLRPLPDGVTIGGSIPRDQLMEVYQRSDALIFPTLCDGFGMVATEAWSRGLPVITTTCAGAADLLKPYENGLLVPAGDASALAEAITWCLEHRADLRAMRENALHTAASWQWRDYRTLLAGQVQQTLNA
jgi:glycosyltransferase involved in cell wall biosynthesis